MSTNRPAELLRQEYISSVDGLARDFFLYTPNGFDKNSNQKWPLILFLHGNGERGNGKEDLDHVLTNGILYEAWIQKRDLPFLIVAPQLHLFDFDKTNEYLKARTRKSIPERLEDGVPHRPEEYETQRKMKPASKVWFFPKRQLLPMGWEQAEKDLLSILDFMYKNFHADTSRVYLTGLSYGGFGTWYMASKHPDRFAAICPIVGWGHPKLMKPVADARLPVWAFSGGRDHLIETKYFFAGMNRLEDLGHKNVRYTIHADMEHDTWRRVYEGQDIYDWFLSHRKPKS